MDLESCWDLTALPESVGNLGALHTLNLSSCAKLTTLPASISLLTQLDEQLFWQVHRSVIVNHRHIASAVRVDEGHMHLTLRGRPETLPVSRHFQSLFKGQ